MDEDLRKFIQETSDNYLFEMILTIHKRILPEDSFIIPLMKLARQYGMPVRNILSFVADLAHLCNDMPNMSQQEMDDLNELFRNSGISTDFLRSEGDDSDEQ